MAADESSIAIPAEEVEAFAGFAALLSTLEPPALVEWVGRTRDSAEAAAEAGDPEMARRTMVAQAIVLDEVETRAPGAVYDLGMALDAAQDEALAALLAGEGT